MECPTIECPACPTVTCPKCQDTSPLFRRIALQKEQLEESELLLNETRKEAQRWERQFHGEQNRREMCVERVEKMTEKVKSMEEAEKRNGLEMQTLQVTMEKVVLEKKEMEERLAKLSESLLEERKKNMEMEEKLAAIEKQYRAQLDENKRLEKEKERIRSLNSAGEECSDVYSYFRRFIWSENAKNEAVTPAEDYLNLTRDQRVVRCLMYSDEDIPMKQTSLWESSTVFYSVILLCTIVIRKRVPVVSCSIVSPSRGGFLPFLRGVGAKIHSHFALLRLFPTNTINTSPCPFPR